jgi:anti-anti-sigma factor
MRYDCRGECEEAGCGGGPPQSDRLEADPILVIPSALGAAMKLSLRPEEAGFCRIQTDGEIRLSEQARDPQVVESLLGPDCYRRMILLDLQNTSYMDSSGVSWLVSFHKHCREAGGILVIHSIPPSIMAILRLLHMDRYLNLVEDESAARVVAIEGGTA